MDEDEGLRRYIQSLPPRLTADEEVTLLSMGEAGRRELIERNLRVVVSIAGKYQGRGVETTELVAEGNLRLVQFAQHYIPREGLRFSVRLYPILAWAMKQLIWSHARPVRLPDSAERKLWAIRRAQEKLAQQEYANLIDVALTVSSTIEEVAAIINADLPAMPLDGPLAFDEDDTPACLADVLIDSDPPVDEQVIKTELARRVQEAVKMLSEREQVAFLMRYGQDKSYGEIGRSMGCSDEWSRRQGHSAEAKLRVLLSDLAPVTHN